MAFYATLHELIEKDSRSKELFERFTPDMQVMLQEQRQNIHTHQDLERFANSFQKRRTGW